MSKKISRRKPLTHAEIYERVLALFKEADASGAEVLIRSSGLDIEMFERARVARGQADTLLRSALDTGEPELLDVLLMHSIWLKGLDAARASTALLNECVRVGASPAMVAKAFRLGQRPDLADDFGRTPLGWAIERGDERAFLLLIERGVDPETRANGYESGRKMIAAGSHPNADNMAQLLALPLFEVAAGGASRQPAQERELLEALARRDLADARSAMNAGAFIRWVGPDGNLDAMEVFARALRLGRLDVVKLMFLETPMTRDDLMRAAIAANSPAAEVYEWGAGPAGAQTGRGSKGASLLRHACLRGSAQAVAALLRAGSDPDAADLDGNTARDASEMDNPMIAELLQDAAPRDGRPSASTAEESARQAARVAFGSMLRGKERTLAAAKRRLAEDFDASCGLIEGDAGDELAAMLSELDDADAKEADHDEPPADFPVFLAEPEQDSPAPAPAQVAWVQVFPASSVKAVRSRAVGDADSKKVAERACKLMERDGGERIAKGAPDGSAIASLRESFPTFHEVIDDLASRADITRRAEAKAARPRGFKMPNILLVGAPGMGKTHFARALAEACALDFHEVQMGASTSFALAGVNAGYSTARPGSVFEALADGLLANPLFLLDEIDKASGSDVHSVMKALFSLLERGSSTHWQDVCVEAPMDASHVNFVASANSVDGIDSAILSRFTVYEIPEPDEDQSRKIARSVYRQVLSREGWADLFESELPEATLKRLAGMTPRDAHAALSRALPLASQRGRDHALPEDFKAPKPKPRAIGF